MAWSLNGCRAKIRRAKTHLKTLREVQRTYIASNPYELLPEFDSESGWHTLYVEARPIPDLVGVLVGEIAHHLRSALDHIAWQFASLDGAPSDPEGVQFPILSDPVPDFASIRAVKSMRSEHIAALEGLQPYHRGQEDAYGKSGLEMLAAVSNTDKHRVIHAAAAIASEIAPHRLDAYEGYRLQAAEFEEGPIMLEGRTMIGRVRLMPASPDLQMYVQGALDLFVAFSDPDSVLNGSSTDGLLEAAIDMVDGIANVFDRPGRSGIPPWP